MQETTKVPPSVGQSRVIEALHVDEDLGEVSSEMEEANIVAILQIFIVAAIVVAIVVSTMVSSKTVLISSVDRVWMDASDRFRDAASIILELNTSSRKLLLDTSSPQYSAVQWLSEEDGFTRMTFDRFDTSNDFPHWRRGTTMDPRPCPSFRRSNQQVYIGRGRKSIQCKYSSKESNLAIIRYRTPAAYQLV
jgi:hypothetical protein